MKYLIGLSTLLAAGAAAVYVDAAFEQIHHARDIHGDSRFHVRDVDELLTTIVQRSPKGGSPKGAGGGGSGGSKQPSSPSKSHLGSSLGGGETKSKSGGQSTQEEEVKGRSGSPGPRSPKLSSKSPSISPARGRASDGGSGSPQGRSKSPVNPFAAVADTGPSDWKGAAFPALADRLRIGGTLEPQPRRRPKVFDSGVAGSNQGRPAFTGAGQGALFSGSRLTGHGGGAGGGLNGGTGGRVSGGAPQSRAESQTEAARTSRQQSTLLPPGAGESQANTGQESSSNQGPTIENRLLKDNDMYTYFTRSFDTLPASIWTRDTIDSNILLQPRGSPIKPSNGGNSNPTSARRRESTARNSSNTQPPARANSPPVRGNSPPQADSPRPLRSASTLARTSNQNLQALMANHVNNINHVAQHPSPSPQTPPTTLQTGWRSGFLRSAMRSGSGSIGSMGSTGMGNERHVTFADPVATPILPSRLEIPRSSSTESIGEVGR